MSTVDADYREEKDQLLISRVGPSDPAFQAEWVSLRRNLVNLALPAERLGVAT
jgi:hypothetical protein